MAEWMFDRSGRVCLIFAGFCVRNINGSVVGWISESSVYALSGSHIGWYDDGVIYDSSNRALAFTASKTGSLPSVPELSSTPGMPGFSVVPGRPGVSATPGMPGRGGWSSHDARSYFTA